MAYKKIKGNDIVSAGCVTGIRESIPKSRNAKPHITSKIKSINEPSSLEPEILKALGKYSRTNFNYSDNIDNYDYRKPKCSQQISTQPRLSAWQRYSMTAKQNKRRPTASEERAAFTEKLTNTLALRDSLVPRNSMQIAEEKFIERTRRVSNRTSTSQINPIQINNETRSSKKSNRQAFSRPTYTKNLPFQSTENELVIYSANSNKVKRISTSDLNLTTINVNSPKSSKDNNYSQYKGKKMCISPDSSGSSYLNATTNHNSTQQFDNNRKNMKYDANDNFYNSNAYYNDSNHSSVRSYSSNRNNISNPSSAKEITAPLGVLKLTQHSPTKIDILRLSTTYCAKELNPDMSQTSFCNNNGSNIIKLQSLQKSSVQWLDENIYDDYLSENNDKVISNEESSNRKNDFRCNNFSRNLEEENSDLDITAINLNDAFVDERSNSKNEYFDGLDENMNDIDSTDILKSDSDITVQSSKENTLVLKKNKSETSPENDMNHEDNIAKSYKYIVKKKSFIELESMLQESNRINITKTVTPSETNIYIEDDIKGNMIDEELYSICSRSDATENIEDFVDNIISRIPDFEENNVYENFNDNKKNVTKDTVTHENLNLDLSGKLTEKQKRSSLSDLPQNYEIKVQEKRSSLSDLPQNYEIKLQEKRSSLSDLPQNDWGYGNDETSENKGPQISLSQSLSYSPNFSSSNDILRIKEDCKDITSGLRKNSTNLLNENSYILYDEEVTSRSTDMIDKENQLLSVEGRTDLLINSEETSGQSDKRRALTATAAKQLAEMELKKPPSGLRQKMIELLHIS